MGRPLENERRWFLCRVRQEAKRGTLSGLFDLAPQEPKIVKDPSAPASPQPL